MLFTVAFICGFIFVMACIACSVQDSKTPKNQRKLTIFLGAAMLLITVSSGWAGYIQVKSMKYEWEQTDRTPIINLAATGQPPVYAYESGGTYCYAWRDSAGQRHDDSVYANANATINDSWPTPEIIIWQKKLTKMKWKWLGDPGFDEVGSKYELRVPRGTIQVIANCG